jgi:tetratricopeptide (TPR) repeat protein
LAAFLAVALAGCRESGVQGCLDLVHAGRYEAAAQRCGEVYTAQHDPRAGAAVVLARYSLGQQDEVLAWVDRLAKADRVRRGVWSLAAAVHEQRGEATAADREYRRDLALFRASGEHQGMADSLLRLSLLAWHGSRYRDAFLTAGEALQEATAAKDRGLQAASANALYTALDSVGDLAGARRALEAAGALESGQDRTGRAYLLANWGNLLTDEGRLALARRDLEQALELGAGIAEPQFFRSIHVNLTKVHLDGGDVERAAHHLEEAWKHTEPGQPAPTSLLDYRARVDLARGRPAEAIRTVEAALHQEPAADWAWDLELLRGKAEEARGDPGAAEAAYRRSIGIVEEMRRSLTFDDLKSCLLDRNRQPFEALFRLEARAGRAEDALATAERAEARTLLDAFLHTSSAAEPGRPPARWSPAASADRMQALEALLPAMSESPVASVQPVERVLRAFGGRHGLVYFEAGDTIWLIVVAGGKPRLLPLAAPPAEVHRLGDRFLAHPDDARTAERLGGILLPSGSLPPRGRSLHVVVDGRLADLPFAALRQGGRYLVEDYAIVFLPSLNALAALESRPGSPPGPPGPALALGDSQGDLPAARSEAMTVAGLLGGSARTAGQATSGELRNAARARVLHLATHTGLGPGGPWLQLADRRVSAAEILTGRIGPRLAVLASCSSGARTGRQMWGSLGAAFLAAGSRAVLAALGSIEDAPARELVLGFYRAGGASDPAGALARAQRVAIGRGLSPTFWAPFVLFGSDRPPDEAL